MVNARNRNIFQDHKNFVLFFFIPISRDYSSSLKIIQRAEKFTILENLFKGGKVESI